MRTIKKRIPPVAFTEWRVPRMVATHVPGMDCTYSEMRRDHDVLVAVEDSLVAEQGFICAYTGMKIGFGNSGPSRIADFHIEHLTPQRYCTYGQDTDYDNIVACWPRPNCGFEPAFGARKKDSWPSPTDAPNFVSPLRSDCTTRFSFNRRGEISPAVSSDSAAEETIRRLALDHPDLVALRKAAIQGALSPSGKWLGIMQCKRLRDALDRAATNIDSGAGEGLMPFWFAVRQALERRIISLEGERRGS